MRRAVERAFVSRHDDPRHQEEMAIGSIIYGYRELAETQPRDMAARSVPLIRIEKAKERLRAWMVRE